MPTKPRRSTQADYDLFQDTVKKLLKLFGICEWIIYYEWCALDGNAQCSSNSIIRTATFSFATSVCLYSDEDIKSVALHEVCHLLLAEIECAAYSRCVTLDEIRRAQEFTAWKLHSLLLDKLDEL